MLNLSDKDLDRLSREAASEHDPGDVVGPRSWDKLEIRLDRHLGHVTPHPARGFYRLPFYYAPVVLLILGASYYFMRNHRAQKEASSGSPPLTLVKPAPTGADKYSTPSQNPTQTDKSTSTLVLPPATSEQPTAPAAGAGPGHDLTSGGSAAPATGHSATGNPAPATPAAGTPAASSRITGSPAPSSSAPSSSGTSTAVKPSHGASASKLGRALARPLPATNGHDRSVTSAPGSSNAAAGLSGIASPTGAAPLSGERLLSLSTVRGPVPTKRRGSVSDSALRAFTVKATPTPIQRKGGLYINRSLQIGLLAAPDFSSVSSMSGDKPGSSIGLTADYQFAHRWYVGTGLLLSRKNYAAAPPNFHVPANYDNLPNIDFVKGSFSMLEVPLNLRYDFSVAGNTLFFVSAGLSSYLLTSESCNYYYQWYNQPKTKNMHYDNRPDYLFSALDLSMGVEMGINNSMSVLVAPYVKVPVRNIGFGQVELSSVGINFIFEFTPVLSRSR